MCPSAQPSLPDEIGLYWSDEQIFSILDDHRQGFCLPNNVLADLSPYQHQPSNLPEGIWYLVPSNEKKESVFGFWKPKGEACKIYSNSLISGWRATFEYFEGQAPEAQKTEWLMQEYKITLKELCEKNNPKESKSLCRVFLCSGSRSENETCSKDCNTVIGSKEVDLMASLIPNTDATSKQYPISEKKAKKEGDVVADKIIPNSSLQEISEMECFSIGDYLELNDLEDPESHSSSSQNSSCPSKLSDEYFDTLALLHELEEENAMQSPGNHYSSRYSFTTSVRSNNVVMPPTSSGSIVGGAASAPVTEGLSDERVGKNAAKKDVKDLRNEGTSKLSDAATPSTSLVNAISNGEKKPASRGKTKKLKLYFCFMWI